MHMTCQKKNPFMRKFLRKMQNAGRPGRGPRFLRACTIEMHMDIMQWTCHKSHAVWKLQGKCRKVRLGTPFCASLRSRNAHGHFTRSIWCGNLQGNCRTLRTPCRSTSATQFLSEEPQVWPHCLGKNPRIRTKKNPLP